MIETNEYQIDPVSQAAGALQNWTSDTYNVPSDFKIGQDYFLRGYLDAVERENRTSPVYVDANFYSDSGTVSPQLHMLAIRGPIAELIFAQRSRVITAHEAYQLAVGALLRAEERRKRERELEAKFWEDLDGDA